MRFVRRTSREAGDHTSDHVSLPAKFRGRRHSSNPSRMNKTLKSFLLVRFSPFVSGKNWVIRSIKLWFSFSFKLIYLNGRGNMKLISWFSFPSAQSRTNFCTETDFPMPATPFVNTVLICLSCSAASNKFLHSTCISCDSWRLEATSICLTSCSVLTCSLQPWVI